MKKNYPDMHILDETDKYFIGHIYEDAYLIDKRNGQEILHDDFYGDPTCGLIGRSDEWAIIAGEHVTIWKNGKATKIDKEELRWVHAMRQMEIRSLKFLLTPGLKNQRSGHWT
jgi:hypothetical protein